MVCATTISMCDSPGSKGSSHPTHRAPLVVTRSVRQFATCGLLASLRLVKRKHGTACTPFAPEVPIGPVCQRECLATGLVMRSSNDRMVIAPPLVITPAQIDELMALMRRGLDRTWTLARREGWLDG